MESLSQTIVLIHQKVFKIQGKITESGNAGTYKFVPKHNYRNHILTSVLDFDLTPHPEHELGIKSHGREADPQRYPWFK